ncbi:MAG: hypothetical protein U0271_24435 [Polyangiaceae bacterium]
MSERWSTTDWGDACGPKPTPSGGAPGGSVSVAEAGGELAFSGAGRSFTTAQCWEQGSGITRTSHSASKRGWSNRCSSAPNDPRKAAIVTSISATNDTIVFSEQGVFEFNIQNTKCHATVSRSRSFKLVKRVDEVPAPASSASATPSASAPPTPSSTAREPREPAPRPTPTPVGDCEPGAAPTRLEVRPARKLMRPGDAFELTVEVKDAKGCSLGVEPEITFEGDEALANKLTITEHKITAAPDAPEGTVDVVVTLQKRSVRVTVEVTPPDKYESLLVARGLNAAGEDDRTAVLEVSTGFGGDRSVAEDTARQRKITFLAIVGGIAALLGLVGFVMLRRGRRAPDTAPASSRESFVAPPPNVSFFDRSGKTTLECPKCGSVYEEGTGFCATDGAPLVPSKKADPAPRPSEVRSPTGQKMGKICPSCGTTFPADAGFCGKDGTQLVPIN